MTQMAWQRDSYFTDYPAGHLGEPSGTCKAGDVSFRASKRGLHWLTLTNAAGAGLALLPQDLPLTARADPGLEGTTLFASREVAGPLGLQRELGVRARHPRQEGPAAVRGFHAAGDYAVRHLRGRRLKARQQRHETGLRRFKS